MNVKTILIILISISSLILAGCTTCEKYCSGISVDQCGKNYPDNKNGKCGIIEEGFFNPSLVGAFETCYCAVKNNKCVKQFPPSTICSNEKGCFGLNDLSYRKTICDFDANKNPICKELKLDCNAKCSPECEGCGCNDGNSICQGEVCLGSLNPPKGWMVGGTPSAVVVYDGKDKLIEQNTLDGSKSMMMSFVPETDAWSGAYKEFEFKMGTRYRLSAWMKAEPGFKGFVLIGEQVVNSANTYNHCYINPDDMAYSNVMRAGDPDITSWKYYFVDFKTSSGVNPLCNDLTGAFAKGKVLIMSGSKDKNDYTSGTVYVDNVVLEEVFEASSILQPRCDMCGCTLGMSCGLDNKCYDDISSYIYANGQIMAKVVNKA